MKAADKTPRTYDYMTFCVDGCLDLDITFKDKTMKTPIYLKMDAKEQLLLCEGVCRQLGIISYHPQVTPGDTCREDSAGYVPTVRVQLVQTVKLRPQESVMAQVRLIGGCGVQSWDSETLLLEFDEQSGLDTGGRIISSLVQPLPNDIIVMVPLSDSYGWSTQEISQCFLP